MAKFYQFVILEKNNVATFFTNFCCFTLFLAYFVHKLMQIRLIQWVKKLQSVLILKIEYGFEVKNKGSHFTVWIELVFSRECY